MAKTSLRSPVVLLIATVGLGCSDAAFDAGRDLDAGSDGSASDGASTTTFDSASDTGSSDDTFDSSLGDSGASDSASSDSRISDSSISDSAVSDSAISDSGGTDATSRDSSTSDARDAVVPPLNHRPDDSPCGVAAPRGGCSLGFAACKTDGDCTGGTSGRCILTTGGAVTCRCTYDECGHDTDCKGGETCACHGTAYTGGSGSVCMKSGCRIDKDCGEGGFCSPSPSTTGCGGLGGYYCHTAADTCVNDRDCPSGTGPQICAFTTSTGRWDCHTSLLCP